MKFFYYAMVFLFFLVSASPSPASANSFHLKFATQDFPPFSYLSDPTTNLSNQVVTGPVADVIKHVCKKMNVKCTLKLLPWRRAIYDAKEHQMYHGLFVLGWNQKRTEWIYFTPPVLTTEYGFFVQKSNRLSYQTVKDLNDYKIGVYGPSNLATSLEKIQKKLNNFTIEMRPDDISGFKKLSIQRVQAVYSNRDAGFAIINREEIPDIRYAGKEKALNYYIGFLKNNIPKYIVDDFNKTYLELHKQGTIQQILKKYDIQPSIIDYTQYQ